jgi:hypothetical protein
MMAKPLLIAKAFSHHARCAALAIKQSASFFFLVIFVQEQLTTSR